MEIVRYLFIKNMKKQYISAQVKEIKEGGIIVGAVATTDSPDRDGEILSIDGWELDNFIKNPVLLWGHDSRALPIGKVTNIKRVKNSLVFNAQFAVEENDFAAKVSKLVTGGYLNTFSVGFLPKQRDGDKFTKQELLEISVVNVPANTDAEVSRAFKDFQKVVKSIEKKAKTKEVKKEVKEVKEVKKTEEKQEFSCECIKCGHKLKTDKHCKDVKCPECGGEMRRVERPGPGKEVKKVAKKEIKKEVKEIKKDTEVKKEVKAEIKKEIETKSPACRQKDETEKECVARKIPEIIKEGTLPKQAIAMAFSMCSKPCKSKEVKEEIRELPKIDNKEIKKETKAEKEGRIVSEKNRILIRNTVSTLKEASIALEGLLKVTEPPKGEKEVGQPSIAKKDNTVLKALKRIDRDIEHLILTEKGK